MRIPKPNRALIRTNVLESARSVLPILLIVGLLCLSISPVSPDLLLCFLLGALMLTVGMGLFSIGAETAMTPIGNKVGTAMTKTRRLPLILGFSLLLGFAVTVAEPDLQVLAQTVPYIDTTVLIVTVGIGVGIFLSVCMLRILTGFRLRVLLLIFYGLIFLLASFADPAFLGIAFDSGGVTTGPMTVPFILALGIGVSNIRSDEKAEADSFGLVALCSIGPILSVLLLGFFYRFVGSEGGVSFRTFDTTGQIGRSLLSSLPSYMKEMALSMLPIVLIFLLFQVFFLRIPARNLAKICVGLLYAYVGLVLFLSGANFGFSSLGYTLGRELASGWTRALLVPLAALLGWFIISAEPAVSVLEKQIEEVSAGAVPGKAIKLSLSAAIALSMAISMLRVLYHIPILYFLLPGYALSLLLSFFVPDLYTAIAFDSGGVASGPMTATFMLQFVMGVSSASGGNAVADSFGVVALVAMMPLLSIQLVGFVCGRLRPAAVEETFGDCDIVELWEEAA